MLPNFTPRRVVLGLVAGLSVTGAVARADEPVGLPPGIPTAAQADADYATRPVAYLHGGAVSVTRKDLGEFLINRMGAEKVELLVNKMIIEEACRQAGVAVSRTEMEAALADDLSGLSIQKEQFIQAVLPRYGKTYYEWMEDVIRPRLLLTKLCRDQVRVDDRDVQIQYDREYGEKRRVQMIGWPKNDDLKSIQKQYAVIRDSQEEFDRAARSQPNPALAGANGYVKPISRHLPAQEKHVEERAFSMKPGEVSEIIETSQGYIVMKLHEVIPPVAGVTFEAVKPRLEKQAFEERMSQAIPTYFAELKEKAMPKVMFTGPSEWQFVAPSKSAADLLKGVIPADATGGAGAPVVPVGGTK